MGLALAGETVVDVSAGVVICEGDTTPARYVVGKELAGNKQVRNFDAVTPAELEDADDLYEAAVADDLDTVAPGILGTFYTTMNSATKATLRTAILNYWGDPDPTT